MNGANKEPAKNLTRTLGERNNNDGSSNNPQQYPILNDFVRHTTREANTTSQKHLTPRDVNFNGTENWKTISHASPRPSLAFLREKLLEEQIISKALPFKVYLSFHPRPSPVRPSPRLRKMGEKSRQRKYVSIAR